MGHPQLSSSLLLTVNEMGSAILLPARLVLFSAEGLLFAVADCLDPAAVDSELYQDFVTPLARLSPSARLYSVEPRSSQ